MDHCTSRRKKKISSAVTGNSLEVAVRKENSLDIFFFPKTTCFKPQCSLNLVIISSFCFIKPLVPHVFWDTFFSLGGLTQIRMHNWHFLQRQSQNQLSLEDKLHRAKERKDLIQGIILQDLLFVSEQPPFHGFLSE